MMIRKTVFDAFGYFDTQLGRSGNKLLGSEEKAFFDRIRKNGVQLHYWAGLHLTHRIGNHRLEKEYLKKQSVGIGRSERLRFRMFLQKLQRSLQANWSN
jgi:glucosyl-dolichyl phosphate glucuronosyltransferase